MRTWCRSSGWTRSSTALSLGWRWPRSCRDWRRSDRATGRCRCSSRRRRSSMCEQWAKASTHASPCAPRAGRARAVAFNTGGRLGVAEGEPAQATFALEINEWNGVSEPRLVLRHARAAGAPRIEDRRAPSRSRATAGRACPRPVCRSWCCSAEDWRQAALVSTPWCGQPRPSIREGSPLTCDYGPSSRDTHSTTAVNGRAGAR